MAKDLYRDGLTGALLRNPLPQRLAQWGLLFALALLIGAAWGRERLPGIDDPHPLIYTHATTLLFWVAWFMGIVLAAPLVGRAWCGVCPLGYLSERLGRIGFNLRWPGGVFKYLPVLAVFVAGVAAAVFFDAHKSPHQTALLVGAMTLLAVLTGLVWRRSLFCGRLCPVGVVLSLYSRSAPLKVGSRDEGKCAACASRACVARKGQWKRWDAGTVVLHKKSYNSGCPVALDPPTMDDNQCLMCLECVRSCPDNNMGLFLGKKPSTKFNPVTAQGALMLPLLAGLVSLALVRTWPMVRDMLAPGAYPSANVWGLWFGVSLPLILLVPPVALSWLSARSGGKTVSQPPAEGETTPGTAPRNGVKPAPLSAIAGKLFAPFAGLVLGGHAALALVKLNAKASYLPYLFYDPLGATTYHAIHVSGMLELPGLLIPLEAVKYLAFGLLALGALLGLRELRTVWLGKVDAFRPGTLALLLAFLGFAALAALYGATLYHWLFMGR